MRAGDRLPLSFVLIAGMAMMFLPVGARRTTAGQPNAAELPSPDDVMASLGKTLPVRETLRRQGRLLGKAAPALQLARWTRGGQEAADWPPKKPTLLWFWDLDCGGCKHRLKDIAGWAAQIQEAGGQLIAVHAYADDDRMVDVRKVLAENACVFNVAIDQYCGEAACFHSQTFCAFGVGAVPICVTVDTRGRILSYRTPKPASWKEWVKQVSGGLEPNPPEEAQPLTVRPSSWAVRSAPPHSRVSGRFLLYRPDTPELAVRALRSGDPNMMVTFRRHSGQGQTVFVLEGHITAPSWGRTLKGTISVEVEYSKGNDTVAIPFRIASTPLVVGPPKVFLGLLRKGTEKALVKTVILQSNVPREELELQVIHTPEGMMIELPEPLGTGCGEIPVRIRFQAAKMGTYRDTIKVKAVHRKTQCDQPVELECTGIVHE